MLKSIKVCMEQSKTALSAFTGSNCLFAHLHTITTTFQDDSSCILLSKTSETLVVPVVHWVECVPLKPRPHHSDRGLNPDCVIQYIGEGRPSIKSRVPNLERNKGPKGHLEAPFSLSKRPTKSSFFLSLRYGVASTAIYFGYMFGASVY